MKVVIHVPTTSQADWQALADLPRADQLVVADSADLFRQESSDAEVLVLGGQADASYLARAGRLRWLQICSAGVERFLEAPALQPENVVVTNVRGVLSSHVAETGIALLTGLARGIHHAVRDQQVRRWTDEHEYDELTGKRALIVGTGGIGRAMARRLHGLEVEVRGADLRPQQTDEYLPDIQTLEALPDLLAATDVLVICCPATEATHHLVDAEVLAALPRGAYLINVSRGSIVDTDAMVAALQSGQLGGAGLDVLEEEPPSPEHPIWELPNVILTPHVGGRSPLRLARVIEFVVRNVRRYKAGEPLLNVVDKQAGF